ncbi:hypothetical protein [Nocardiopsis sp. NPDC006938]|uniref:hypothetical protein n=1 Tax=Nocardiopsis sp. NPDC006938 TaxID=3364337 RepID=UPI00369160C5
MISQMFFFQPCVSSDERAAKQRRRIQDSYKPQALTLSPSRQASQYHRVILTVTTLFACVTNSLHFDPATYLDEVICGRYKVVNPFLPMRLDTHSIKPGGEGAVFGEPIPGQIASIFHRA